MAKWHKPEEIITKLGQFDVLVSQGSNVADAIRGIGVTGVTYYLWQQEYGGTEVGPGQADEGPLFVIAVEYRERSLSSLVYG